jgi:hypothetical protein
MGKRSDFERRDRDAYPTPFKAVLPLIPHLRGIRTYAEPCAGDDALVRHLETFGLRCVYQGDIATGQDALAIDSYGGADAIITNPPYVKPLMHDLIEHFRNIAPTWLLLELDWSATKQARPFLPSCSDIVPFGRLKWIIPSDHTGYQNYAWYRFNIHHTAGPVLHPRGSAPVASHATLCGQCGRPYRPQRSTSKFCSDTCRQRAHRSRLSVTKRDAEPPPREGAAP